MKSRPRYLPHGYRLCHKYAADGRSVRTFRMKTDGKSLTANANQAIAEMPGGE